MSDMGRYILDADGNPVAEPDLVVWGAWFGNGANRIVAKTDVEGVEVSTVFLGIDHNFSPAGPPLLFETMVFGGPLDGEQDRYATRAEALAGHTEMVRRALEAKP